MAGRKRCLGATLVHVSPGRFKHDIMICLVLSGTPLAGPGAVRVEFPTVEAIGVTAATERTEGAVVRDTLREDEQEMTQLFILPSGGFGFCAACVKVSSSSSVSART